jgi:hypothetical protein
MVQERIIKSGWRDGGESGVENEEIKEGEDFASIIAAEFEHQTFP